MAAISGREPTIHHPMMAPALTCAGSRLRPALSPTGQRAMTAAGLSLRRRAGEIELERALVDEREPFEVRERDPLVGGVDGGVHET